MTQHFFPSMVLSTSYSCKSFYFIIFERDMWFSLHKKFKVNVPITVESIDSSHKYEILTLIKPYQKNEVLFIVIY